MRRGLYTCVSASQTKIRAALFSARQSKDSRRLFSPQIYVEKIIIAAFTTRRLS